MKKVLYLTNIEVPYRVRFFNELAKHCDLTVVYERKKSKTRNAAWASGEQCAHRAVFLNGVNLSSESAFSFGILRYIFDKKYDAIVVGCYNSPIQMMAILLMRLFGIPYCLSTDGEIFLNGSGIKNKIKRFVLSGAQAYLAAGERCADSLAAVAGDKPVYPYYFSSLDRSEIMANRSSISDRPRNGTVLVVGQYLDVKGLDVALNAAQMDPDREYLFVGMGKRTALFTEKYHPERVENVRIIPFLQKKDLEAEYRRCALMVLPSRQECWGLVINEAASFGTPIVSTTGSGAAVEFLSDGYPQYLAVPGDEKDLHRAILQLINTEDLQAYSMYLMNKSESYTIEKGVQVHLHAFGIEV